MENNGIGKLFEGVDRWTVLIYVLIVLVGFVAILSASYEEGAESIFSFSHFYMKQLVWMGISFAVAVVVLLVDASIYHKWAYLFYVLGLLTLVAALLFGREVNGAKAWFEIGSVRIQPVEFAKIATALALARVMSSSSFSINRAGDLFKVGLVICLPLLIIVMQNDTGSGIVLVSLLFVLYREGLNKWLCIPVILIAVLFIFSFLFTPLTLLVMLILVCTLSEAMMNGQWRSRMVYLAALALGMLKNERLSWETIFGCIAGLAGVILINLTGILNGSFSFRGEGLMLAAAASYGISNVYLKKIVKQESPMAITSYQILFGSLLMIIIGICMGGRVQVYSLKAACLLLYLAALSAAAFSIWTLLLKYNPVGKVTMFAFSIPVFGVIMS